MGRVIGLTAELIKEREAAKKSTEEAKNANGKPKSGKSAEEAKK